MRLWSSFLFAVLILTGCADDLLLHPSTGQANAGSAQRRSIELHGKTIELFVVQSPGAKVNGEARAYALEFCGNATRAEYITDYVAKRWDQRPVEVWVMNYPGFGGSTGPASLSAIPAAALATYDALMEEAQGQPIIVSGSSLGCSAALCVAARRPAAAVVLHNPPPLHQMISLKYGVIFPAPVVMQIPSELDSIANAKRTNMPAVVVLSGKDSVVGPRYQQMVVDAYAGEKHLVHMPDADHGTPIEGEAERQLQGELDWLWTKIEK